MEDSFFSSTIILENCCLSDWSWPFKCFVYAGVLEDTDNTCVKKIVSSFISNIDNGNNAALWEVYVHKYL